ncbi:hypothetical protein R1flu_027879 [Riccia fluitans]|uniref:Uncharacterized protein n=1 Tax=Riccia fluitans TaxID=41844 RepID=A0ABD1XK53_9MARC
MDWLDWEFPLEELCFQLEYLELSWKRQADVKTRIGRSTITGIQHQATKTQGSAPAGLGNRLHRKRNAYNGGGSQTQGTNGGNLWTLAISISASVCSDGRSQLPKVPRDGMCASACYNSGQPGHFLQNYPQATNNICHVHVNPGVDEDGVKEGVHEDIPKDLMVNQVKPKT